MTTDFAELAPGVVLGGLYRIDREVPSRSGTAYFGHRIDVGWQIQLLELPPIYLGPLQRALGITHPALCALLEVLPRPSGEGVAIFEHIPGRTLEDELAESRVLPASRAITAALDIADALTAMHQRGAAHGLLQPAAVISEPEGRAGALLGYAPPSPLPSPYHSPERGIGAPSPTDDVWALAAILHQMLTGAPPPPAGYRSAREVQGLGIHDPALVSVLAHCLARRPENRISMVQPVRDLLVSHFERTTGDPPVIPQRGASAPPAPGTGDEPATPHEPSVAPQAQAPARATRTRGLMLGGLAGVLAVAAALGVWGALLRARTAHVHSAPMASSAAPVASALPATATTSAPPMDVMSADSLPSSEEPAACVERQFPPGTFREKVNLSWVCATPDARKGFARFRAALVLGAGRGNLTQAMSIWSRLQWYGFAAYAVIRGACCKGAEPLELPRSKRCPPLDEPVAELGALPAGSEGWEAALRAYTKAVRCRSAMGQQTLYGADMPLGGGQETALRELIGARRGP